jgi:superfamily II DNA/RNA helicase
MNSPQSFASLGVPSQIVDALTRQDIRFPFPIQETVIPDIIEGRDISAQAPTGSGKTLAFGIPIVAAVEDAKPRRPRALILAPTRELAEQIASQLRPLASAMAHSVMAVYGGVGYRPQIQGLDRGAEIVVACPGRLEDLLEQRALVLDDVEYVVIDEADRMADMGFLPSVRRIVGATSARRQTLLFSATLDGAVGKLVRDVQTDPIHHVVGATGPDTSSATHIFWKAERTDRPELAANVVKRLGSAMVFTRTRHGADRLAQQLERFGVAAAPIHGGRSQPQRDRALDAFARGQVQALVATDVAARGIHVDAVAGVIHFDPPEDAAAYLHRSGRTARAGATGTVVSLVTNETHSAVRRLQSDIGLPRGIADVDLEIVPVTDPIPLRPAEPKTQKTHKAAKSHASRPPQGRPGFRGNKPASNRWGGKRSKANPRAGAGAKPATPSGPRP